MLNNSQFFYFRIKDMETLLSYLTAGIKLTRSLCPFTKSRARAAVGNVLSLITLTDL